ncbi:MAG TPA: lysozyme inhibitor LprI family protein [Candidatus Elarobacter sp.]|jgi:uncharacterized protein YecT (DUF1311 family)|nr:lysozyme inhibitor LprI family protein [Candidatus Elarobacter sp.]
MLMTIVLATAVSCSHAQTQLAMNTCTAQAAKADDAREQKAYAALVAHVEAPDKPLVQAAERAWSAYRDAECKATAARFTGGSIMATELSTCRSTLDADRIRVLQAAMREGG